MIRWLDHTADVQLEITSRLYEGIFTGLVEGMKQLLAVGDVKSSQMKTITLSELNPAALLVALGREILIHFNMRQVIPSHLVVSNCSARRLEGTLWGEFFNPARQSFHCEVKGITYHNLEVVQKAGQWRAVVTFDV